MKVFFHHVGADGAREDFKKTVFSKVAVDFILENIPDEDPLKRDISQCLFRNFPSGHANCWGVPRGAQFVIRNLQQGDYVLLVRSIRIDGDIPALCAVKAYWNHELPSLSKALWGSDKYPYVFFFDTEQLDYLWIQFVNDIGYKGSFNPRGMFYSISDSRLQNFGSGIRFIDYLRASYGAFSKAESKSMVEEDRAEYSVDVENEIKRLYAKVTTPPQLTDETAVQTSMQTELLRDKAFSRVIKLIYKERCAFCGLSLKSKDGHPEVESAHIYPKRLHGADDIRNGICLCRFHHWAFDAGWLAISDEYRLLVHEDIPQDGRYQQLMQLSNLPILLPENPQLNPHPLFLKAHRDIIFYT